MDEETKTVQATPGQRRKKPKALLLLVSIVGVLILVGLLAVPRLTKEKPAIEASAYGKTLSVSQKDYAVIKVQAKKYKAPDSVIRDIVAQALKYRLVAAHYNVYPTDEEVWRSATQYNDVSSASAMNQWQRDSSFPNAVTNKLRFKQHGGTRAAVLLFPYDDLYVHYDEDVPLPKGYGDAAAIAAKKAYALKTAQTDRQVLVKDPSKVETVINRLHLDQQLQFAGASNDSYSFELDNQGTANELGNQVTESVHGYIRDAIKSLDNKTGASEIQQIIANHPSFIVAPGFPTTLDTAYYFVVVTDTASPNEGVTGSFASDIKKVQVTTNVN